MNKTVLLTGGAGYIGSHTAVELIKAGYKVLVADNLCNSSEESLIRAGKLCNAEIGFNRVNVCDAEALDKVFKEHDIDGVIHFAGLKAVGESVEKPLLYYRNNIDATVSLLEVMQRNKVRTLIFLLPQLCMIPPAHLFIRSYSAEALQPLWLDKVYVRANNQGCMCLTAVFCSKSALL